MKKLILLITLFIAGATFAQEKASEGTIYEVMFTPNLDGNQMFALNNPLNGHVAVRSFNDANSVTRWKAHFSYADVDGADDANMILGIVYGKEKHHDGTDRLATYTGWEAGLLYLMSLEKILLRLSGGIFVGANYYIADNLYIGTEINYTLTVGEDTTVVAPGVNGMLSLGFKL